jgi:hypothetical protein
VPQLEWENFQNIQEKAMNILKRFLFCLAVLSLSACSNTSFESIWHDPSASSVDLHHKTAAAFLISGNEAVRRDFESNLATQLTARGFETLPGYEVLPNTDVTKRDIVLRKLRNTDVDVAVFMRVVDRHQEVSFVPVDTWYGGPYHDRFWWRQGRFYGPRFAGPWPPYWDSGYFQTDTIVSVDSRVYSVPDSKLLWEGLSKTMNPSKVKGFVEELVSQTVKKLKDTGMIAKT